MIDVNESILQYIGSIGGIAGVLSVLIFFAYKYLIQQMREDRKFMEDRLVSLIKDYNATCASQQNAVIAQTQVMTELMTWLKLKNDLEIKERSMGMSRGSIREGN